jgi:hypothetical protein
MKVAHKILLVSFVLLLISGCTGYGVTFQTAPSSELASCNPSLVGDWRIIEGERNAPASDSADFISVNADCSNMYSVSIKPKSSKLTTQVDNLNDGKNYRVQFSNVGENQDYVVVTPKETSFEITPEIKIPSGKIIYQINKGKDGVILRPVDLDKTIKLVLDRKINGQIFIDRDTPTGNQAANVYVRGDAKQIANYLSTLEVYSDERLLLIPTSPNEVKLIQKAIKNFRQDKKQK